MKFSRKAVHFRYFFKFVAVVLSNAAPYLPDTTHPQRAPDTQYTRPGQAALRRTVGEILIFFPFFGGVWKGLHLPTVIQNGGSWRGVQKRFFPHFSMFFTTFDIFFTLLYMNTGVLYDRG
jgi:hypothetical protein